MFIDQFDHIQDVYDHVYLSPHLDDAVLSCGGSIARYSAAGMRVLVVTLCTALPQGPFSTLAEEFHGQWSLPPDQVVRARLHEDMIAMERVGADSYWAGMSDALYRRSDVYCTRAALFGVPLPDDVLLPTLHDFICALRSRTPRAALYAPLGVGNHIDHQIAYTVARAVGGDALAFYEDFPYVAVPGAIEERVAALGGGFVTSIIDIDATLRRKIGAIESYVSQIVALFGDTDTMRHQVVAYAEALRPEDCTYGERLWLPIASV